MTGGWWCSPQNTATKSSESCDHGRLEIGSGRSPVDDMFCVQVERVCVCLHPWRATREEDGGTGPGSMQGSSAEYKRDEASGLMFREPGLKVKVKLKRPKQGPPGL